MAKAMSLILERMDRMEAIVLSVFLIRYIRFDLLPLDP